MSYLQAVILGFVQGLTEFLPVSSSGHLALLQNFFEINADSILIFAVLLHAGTLLAVFAVYRKDIWELILELIATIKDICSGKGMRVNANGTRKLGFMIIIASIPTGLTGLFLEDFFKGVYAEILIIGVGLVLTGTILFIAERTKDNSKTIKEMRFRDALLIGICQSVAIFPGVSRSGSTLFGGLINRLERGLAVKFAFLISIPPILGSLILEIPAAITSDMSGIPWGAVLAGVAAAAVSGFLAIEFMIKMVAKKKLIYFSAYTWALGLGIIVFYLL